MCVCLPTGTLSKECLMNLFIEWKFNPFIFFVFLFFLVDQNPFKLVFLLIGTLLKEYLMDLFIE